MSIKVVGDTQVIANFRNMPGRVRGELIEYIGRAVLRLRAYVSSRKLSGQVLKVRTGTLTRSIDHAVLQDANEIHGVVGTNTVYAGKHEYGSSGPEPVKEHLRLIKEAWGKQLKFPVYQQVRAHTRQVNFPERSFLRSSLKEMQDELVKGMTGAVMKGAKQ